MNSKAEEYILSAFSATPHDIPAYDLFDLVVNRRGVEEKVYRRARKALGIESYRIGKKWHFKNPNKSTPPPSLEEQIHAALQPLAAGVVWAEFLPAVKIALKQIKSDNL